MEKIILKLLGILCYLVKVYLITFATIVFVVTIYGVIYKYLHYNPSNQTIFSYPFVIAVMLAYALAKFNLLVFIIILFHRFNKIEIICESLLYSIFSLVINNYLGDYYPVNLFGLVILMTFIMIFYILIKTKYFTEDNSRLWVDNKDDYKH